MNLKLCLLLLVLCAFISSAEFKKENHGHRHEEKDNRGHKHEEREHGRHGEAGSHGKPGRRGKGRVKALAEQFKTSDSDDDDDPNDWLFELQDMRGKCTSNLCQNGGTCEQKKDQYKCKCTENFRGRRCERRKRICSKETCGVGLCLLTSSPPYYKCKCIPPFAPPNCKIPTPCSPNPCQNNGKCVKDEEDFDCVCQGDFRGRYCQVDSEDCYQGDGESYRGKVSETEDGDECLDWNSEFVLDKGSFPATAFGASESLGPHNYCRNPDGDQKPWCFIKKDKRLRWDYCDVKKCPTSKTNTTDVLPTTIAPPTTIATQLHTTLKQSPIRTTKAPRRVVPTTSKPRVTQSVTSSKGIVRPTTHRPSPTLSGNAARPSPTSSGNAARPSITSAGNTTSTVKDFLTCGKPEPKKQMNRIYGGLKAIPGARPWQVSVQAKPKASISFFRHICGGTLIKPCWVLTAAHCIDYKFEYNVLVGGLNLGLNDPPHQSLQVEKVIVHEQFRTTPSVVYNDIALLKLKETKGQCAKESQMVKTACLPKEPFADGSECTISGWGATETSDHGSAHLLDAQVLLISQEACSTNKLYEAVIDEGMFCAGYLQGGVDSCQGDSGGPLTCERNQTHYIYGVVSWGDSCGEKGKPGVYTKVTKYVDWINKIIAGN